jgi:hypothetical protein
MVFQAMILIIFRKNGHVTSLFCYKEENSVTELHHAISNKTLQVLILQDGEKYAI